MAEIITKSGRKAIKKMAEVSQCVRALCLMPTPEDFALMLIGDLKLIAEKLNSIYSSVNSLLDKYASIPAEFLLKGFDEVINRLNQLSNFAKNAVAATAGVLSSTVETVQGLTNAVGSVVSGTTSALLQVGGGLAYGAVALGTELKLSMTGENKRAIEEDITHEVMRDVVDGKVPVSEMDAEIERRIQELTNKGAIKSGEDSASKIKDGVKKVTSAATESIDGFFGNISSEMDEALNWIDGKKEDANSYIDEQTQKAIEKVQKAKKKVEESIQRVRDAFDELMGDFDEAFGEVTKKESVEGAFRSISENAAISEIDSPVVDAIAQTAEEIANFVANFNIGKTIGAMGGLVVGAGMATLTMDLLPSVNVDRMLKDIIGGVNNGIKRITESDINKNPDEPLVLLEVPDCPWKLSVDDLEKYNADGYNKFLEQFGEENDDFRSEILKKMSMSTSPNELKILDEELKEKEKKRKTALKALRKVRRDAIKARMIERYKNFLSTELEFLKREFRNVRDKIKNDWDTMMYQYSEATREIKKFFTEEGYGGNADIDRCCDRINDDATQIEEMCKSITVELTNTTANIVMPYSIGTVVDNPVHKILEFFKDVKYILTFLKNLIRLGIDIISQFAYLAKIICNNIQSLAEMFKKLKELFGIDLLIDMIEFIISLFKSKMGDAKILLENMITPIYYNETEDYELRCEAIEALLEDDKDGGTVDKFRYTDDVNAKRKYRKKVFGGKLDTDDDIEDVLEELEAKGDREIVAYRSPILNATGDDFAGWIFYHANAYDNMNKTWSRGKKRRRNKLIKKASRKNKIRGGKLVGGVAQLKRYTRFGKYEEMTYNFNGVKIKGYAYKRNSVTGFDAYYWYTKWTNDPTDCDVDMNNNGEDIVVPIQNTSNGSLVELSDGRRVFVKGKSVKSGDYVNVNGVKYRVK